MRPGGGVFFDRAEQLVHQRGHGAAKRPEANGKSTRLGTH